jgi:cell division septation protein DedD
MLSILDQGAVAAKEPEAEPVAAAQPEPSPEAPAESAEYEIVLGRAQIASWLFVVVIAVAVCSSVAYLAGTAATPKKTAAAAIVATPAPATMPTASILVPPKADLPSILKTAGKAGPPLFAEPETGKVYIQIGAVEKGMAMILAEGLRSHGFDAFVANGPSDKIFRVLIGPLPDPDSFRQAKAAVDAIDLAVYARKYEK